MLLLGDQFQDQTHDTEKAEQEGHRIFIGQREALCFLQKETNILEKSCGLFCLPLNDTRRKIFSVLSQTQMQSHGPHSSFPY